MPMVIIVIVNWCGAADTVGCLESLLRLDQEDVSVIVCDNGSNDGSIDTIKSWADGRIAADRSGPAWSCLPDQRVRNNFDYEVVTGRKLGESSGPMPFLTIVDIGDNLGFAGANNVGIRRALAWDDTRFVWLLNNDAIVAPTSLGAMLRYCTADPTIGLCAATLLHFDQPDQIQALGAIHNRWTARAQVIGLGGDAAKLPSTETIERQMHLVPGASMFASRPFLETVGPMADDYFLYFEEADWMKRMGNRFRQAYARDAVVYHRGGATIGSSLLGRPSDTSLYYLTRNALLFTIRNDIAVLPSVFLRVCLDTWRFFVRQDRCGWRTSVSAIYDFLRGRTGKRQPG